MKISSNEDNMMVLDHGRLELFVDQKYIGNEMGIISGNTLETFGLLPYRYYKKSSDSKPSEVGTLDIPTMVKFYPTTLDMNRDVKIYPESEEKKYTVLSFDGGIGMWPKFHIQSLKNVQIFLNSILSGKLDNNIPYTMLVPSWLKNQNFNSLDLKIPVCIMELIIHTMCRDKKTGKPFGEILGTNPNHSLIGYTFLNVRRAAGASVFGGLSFEDQNSAIDMAINTTLQNREQKISPIEKTIKY